MVEEAPAIRVLMDQAHFPNHSGIPSKDELMQQLDLALAKTRSLEEAQRIWPAVSQSMTYRHTSHASGILILRLLVLLVTIWLHFARHYVARGTIEIEVNRRLRKARGWQLQDARRTLVELYGPLAQIRRPSGPGALELAIREVD